MLINKRKNPLVTHLIVGLKNEHGLYKIHTEVSPTQLVGTELLRNIMPIFDACTGHEPDTFLVYEELSHIVKECFRNEVEKKLDNSTRESIIRSALYTVINKV